MFSCAKCTPFKGDKSIGFYRSIHEMLSATNYVALLF